jgi:V8-like Glu-specific endopeptidase
VDEVECRGEELCMVKAEEMNEVMHRNIGAIVSSHPNKNAPAYGTGFLISDNLVLTCGHNIYDRHEQVYFSNILFYPGVSG